MLTYEEVYNNIKLLNYYSNIISKEA